MAIVDVTKEVMCNRTTWVYYTKHTQAMTVYDR